MTAGVLLISYGYFVRPEIVAMCGDEYHFVAIVFALLLMIMFIWGWVAPRRGGAWVQEYTHDVEFTPWRFAKVAGVLLILIVITIYAIFADFSVLTK